MRQFKIAGIVGIGLAALAAGPIGEAQRGGPPTPPGGPLRIESTWAALAFEVKVSNATLERLRPHFESAWREQARAMEKPPDESQSRRERMQEIQDYLDEALRTVLSPEEARKLKEWQASSRPMGRPAGPPPEGFPGGPGMGRRAAPGGDAASTRPPVPKDAAEKRVLEAAGQVARFASVPTEDGRLIRLIAEAMGARNALEIGTSTGYSGLWTALALLRTGGKLTTLELDQGRAETARQNFRKGGVDKLVTSLVGDAHQTVNNLAGPFDMVFIDADKEGYTDYLDKVLPKVRPGGVILAHNVNPGMNGDGYVKRVTTDPALETVFYTEGGGMSITLKKR